MTTNTFTSAWNNRLALLATLFTMVVAVPIRANETAIDEGLGRLCDAVADYMKKHDKPAIGVGDFTGLAHLKSSGGPGLSQRLLARFDAIKVEVRDDAELQLTGTFTTRDERVDPANENAGKEVALRITAQLQTKDGEELDKYSISVHGASALQFTGPTLDLPPKTPEPQLQQKIKEQIEKPQAFLAGAETRASETSPYGVAVYVRREGQLVARNPELVSGRSFVPLQKGEEYIVRLHNRSPIEAAVELTIDGLGMFTFSKDGSRDSRVILLPNTELNIPGWYSTDKHSHAFVITSYPESAAFSRKVTATVGTITAVFSASHDPRKEATDDEFRGRSAGQATGIGRQIDQRYESVKRIVGKPRAIVSVRYDR